jgi:hypothetical protein
MNSKELSAAKHTPGPWALEAKAGRVYVKAHVDGRGKHVAYVIPIVDNAAAMPFNADLLAAAPDMAEALRNALDVLGMNEFERESCRRRIRAVLAKAGL